MFFKFFCQYLCFFQQQSHYYTETAIENYPILDRKLIFLNKLKKDNNLDFILIGGETFPSR